MIQRAEWWPSATNAEVWTTPAGYAITKDLVRCFTPDMITLEHLASTPECEVYKLTPMKGIDEALAKQSMDVLYETIVAILESTQTDEPAKAVARTYGSILRNAAEEFRSRNSSGFGFQRT